nr:MAG TPA: hypothetical protein [Caudoviricetes sp.]
MIYFGCEAKYITIRSIYTFILQRFSCVCSYNTT